MNDYARRLDEIDESYHDADIPDKFIENICQEHMMTWLISKIAEKQSILELGYGDGIINRALVARAAPVHVIEGSPRVVARARALDPSLSIEQVMFENFVPQKRYDCILAMHVLEHVDDPVSLLKKMRSWLSSDGELLVVVPNKGSLHRKLAVVMGLQDQLDALSPRDHAVGHQRVYSHQTLNFDLDAAGYTVVESTGFFLKTLPNGMMLDHSESLIRAMNEISTDLPKKLLANIGMIAGVRD